MFWTKTEALETFSAMKACENWIMNSLVNRPNQIFAKEMEDLLADYFDLFAMEEAVKNCNDEIIPPELQKEMEKSLLHITGMTELLTDLSETEEMLLCVNTPKFLLLLVC